MERLQTDLCSFSFYSLLFLPPFSSLLSEFQMDYPDCRAQTLPACQVLLFPSSSFLTANVATPSFCGGLEEQEELCIPRYQWVRLWSPPGHQFVPPRLLLVGKDLFGCRKRPRLCRSHWGGFSGGSLGRVSRAGMSVLLPPAGSQGFSLLVGPSGVILGMFLPAAIPQLAFHMPTFSLESSRKQGGFGWCL